MSFLLIWVIPPICITMICLYLLKKISGDTSLKYNINDWVLIVFSGIVPILSVIPLLMLIILAPLKLLKSK